MMSEITEILGKNIRQIRKELGWTQEMLAEKAGISVPFMTQIELARKTASLEVIDSLAKALSVPYSKLFTTEISDDAKIAESLRSFEESLTSEISQKIHEKFSLLRI